MMKCLEDLKCDLGFAKCCFGCKKYDDCDESRCHGKCEKLKIHEKNNKDK